MALPRLLEDPKVPLHSNLAESVLRIISLDRKKVLFEGWRSLAEWVRSTN